MFISTLFFFLSFAASVKICIPSKAQECPVEYEEWENQSNITELLVYNSSFNLNINNLNKQNLTIVLGETNVTLSTASNESQTIEYLNLSNFDKNKSSILILNGNITVLNTSSSANISLINGTYGNVTGIISNFNVEFLPNSFYYRHMVDAVTKFQKPPKNIPVIAFQLLDSSNIPKYLQTFFYGSKEELNLVEKKIPQIFQYEKEIGQKHFWIHYQKASKFIDVYLSNVDKFMKILMYTSIGFAGFAVFVFVACVVSYFWNSPPREDTSSYMPLP